jgi:hypothetical protein
MPRVAASNGVRPEIRALAVFKVGVPVTPAEINAYVGTGDYAAKYVSFLNTRYGFTITAQKDKRKVVSYTMVAEPANAEALRASQPKVAKSKAPKAPKTAKAPAAKKTVKLSTIVNKVSEEFAAAKAAKPASKEDIKAKNLATLKAVAAKRKVAKPAPKKKVREFDDVTETFGNSGEVGTSFNVDRDWDSIDGLDLSRIL